MQIIMVGIDHSKAPIALRERFSFTKAQAAEAMKLLRKEGRAGGCLLISTCNRTELYVSGWSAENQTPYEALCGVKRISTEAHKECFTVRQGMEAARHLLRLSCGMNSSIFGEDQIIAQVREALKEARRCGCTDAILEQLFQTAVAAAKRVKSTVRLTSANPSTASNAVAFLMQRLKSLKNVPCLIIGNGQMGLLIANALTAKGAKVAMTLRRAYHKNDRQESLVPAGCEMIPYENRISVLGNYSVVISATLSPHYTILQSDLEGAALRENSLWLDLAVPRDIDPDIHACGLTEVVDIDQLSEAVRSQADQKAMEQALTILDDYEEKLRRRFGFRPAVEQVQEIAEAVGRDTADRLNFCVKKIFNEEKQAAGEETADDITKKLAEEIAGAAEKSAAKMLYCLRDALPQQLWQGCLEALKQGVAQDTLKTGQAKKRYEVTIE